MEVGLLVIILSITGQLSKKQHTTIPMRNSALRDVTAHSQTVKSLNKLWEKKL